jgi:hypothetical protein
VSAWRHIDTRRCFIEDSLCVQAIDQKSALTPNLGRKVL